MEACLCRRRLLRSLKVTHLKQASTVADKSTCLKGEVRVVERQPAKDLARVKKLHFVFPCAIPCVGFQLPQHSI
eukprot:scaffold667838_cov62-Prasinocladus_malaysianus.AAC.1